MSDDNYWLKSTVNDLNNLLQEISGYVHLSREASKAPLRSGRPPLDAVSYLDSCMGSIERATDTVRSILGRLGEAQEADEGNTPGKIPASESIGHELPKSQIVRIINEVPVTNPDGAKETILVVDDEVHVAILAKMMLAENDYRVVTAKDGFEALTLYKKFGNHIDLVLLDFTMPNMNGDKVFEELRKLNPEVSVILSSGFADQNKLNELFAAGLKEFLAKPYTQQRLLSEIRSVLGQPPD